MVFGSGREVFLVRKLTDRRARLGVQRVFDVDDL